VVVAHGRGTEKRFLRAFPGHGFGPWVDTLVLARAVWPGLPSHALQTLCEAAGVDGSIRQLVPDRDWHDALFDAAASLLLLRHIVRALDWLDRPLGLLVPPGS
jgi:DNA polymerase-3 subunit epsilon